MSFEACENRKSKGKQLKRFFAFLLVLVILGMILIFKITTSMQSTVVGLAEVKAKAMISQVINAAIKEEFFQQGANLENLLIINKNNQGSIEMIQSNTVALNVLTAELSHEIKRNYEGMQPTSISVPVGTILGSQILSQMNVYFKIKVLPLSVSNIDFSSEFESQGINQTKYKMYLTIKSKVRIMSPYSSETLECSERFLLVEAVVLGNVPNSYVQVPESEILHVD